MLDWRVLQAWFWESQRLNAGKRLILCGRQQHPTSWELCRIRRKWRMARVQVTSSFAPVLSWSKLYYLKPTPLCYNVPPEAMSSNTSLLLVCVIVMRKTTNAHGILTNYSFKKTFQYWKISNHKPVPGSTVIFLYHILHVEVKIWSHSVLLVEFNLFKTWFYYTNLSFFIPINTWFSLPLNLSVKIFLTLNMYSNNYITNLLNLHFESNWSMCFYICTYNHTCVQII